MRVDRHEPTGRRVDPGSVGGGARGVKAVVTSAGICGLGLGKVLGVNWLECERRAGPRRATAENRAWLICCWVGSLH
jgi:hypothetical protein